MTGPVGSYYPEGINPIKIKVEETYVRAVKGGTGAAKVAGNYAASQLSIKKAKAEGFAQCLYLDAISRDCVDEVGAMNIMFVIGDELITPPLAQGTILAGVTRESVLTLAHDWGLKASERCLGIEEVQEAHAAGKLKECFGTGTAAVISPVGLLGYKGDEIVINDMKIGPVAQRIYDTITGIQYGELEDTYGWNEHIDV
jgi:branched-chain amino acid aminotransferase